MNACGDFVLRFGVIQLLYKPNVGRLGNMGVSWHDEVMLGNVGCSEL